LPESAEVSKTAGALDSNLASGLIGAANNNSVLVNSRRDVYLQVTGVMPSTFNHFLVSLNRGSHFERLDGFSQVESTQSVVIHRREFSQNFRNFINIRPIGVSRDWGINRVQYSLTPAIELTLGQTDTKEYGYSDPEIARLSGLRATFQVDSADSLKKGVALSMTAWDIDRADETALFVNDQFVANLTQSAGNNRYSKRDKFIISQPLLRDGVNNIELVQRDAITGVWSGFEDEKWAVRDILVEEAKSVSIAPIIMLLLDE